MQNKWKTAETFETAFKTGHAWLKMIHFFIFFYSFHAKDNMLLKNNCILWVRKSTQACIFNGILNRRSVLAACRCSCLLVSHPGGSLVASGLIDWALVPPGEAAPRPSSVCCLLLGNCLLFLLSRYLFSDEHRKHFAVIGCSLLSFQRTGSERLHSCWKNKLLSRCFHMSAQWSTISTCCKYNCGYT